LFVLLVFIYSSWQWWIQDSKPNGAKLVDFKSISTISIYNYKFYEGAKCTFGKKNCGARWHQSLYLDPPLLHGILSYILNYPHPYIMIET